MAVDIKNKVFGGDIHSTIKQKISLRQQLAKSSNFGEAVQGAGDNMVGSVDMLKDFNFYKDNHVVVDLSSRTTIARMWTAVNISEDTVVEVDSNPVEIKGKAELATWEAQKEAGNKKGYFLKPIKGNNEAWE